MPIYWALGYHLCRWGYNTSDSAWEVVKNMRNYGIPQVDCLVVYVSVLSFFVCVVFQVNYFYVVFLQDVQWNDIDYMDQFMDFTYDSSKFATLPDMVKDLHAHDQRYVMILVPMSLDLHSYVFLSDVACV